MSHGQVRCEGRAHGALREKNGPERERLLRALASSLSVDAWLYTLPLRPDHDAGGCLLFLECLEKC